MTDKELLELAAKAIGGKYLASCISMDGGNNYDDWEPLIDDGDALRLAIKIGALIEINEAYALSYCHAKFTQRMIVDHGYDSDAATRRAIVLCAAEIGKSMT